jgi:hypothetical protein
MKRICMIKYLVIIIKGDDYGNRDISSKSKNYM